MKFRYTILLCALGAGTLAAAEKAPISTDLAAGASTNVVEKGSYSFGASLANNLRINGMDLDIDQLIAGLKDGLAGKVKFNEQQMREYYFAWQQDARQKKIVKNKQEGEAFLAKKAAEAEVKKLGDGLLYKVIATGNGPQPKPEDSVSAHYRGTLIDGTEFDSSYTRGQPLVTAVRGVVPGWQLALTNMHVGDKWELYIPSHLGYGERGAGAKIGPNATLIFEMELVGIEPPNANPGVPAAANPAGSQPIRVQPPTNQRIRVQPATPAPETK